MKINTAIALSLLLAAQQLHAGEIASKFLCTDGSIIRLDTAGPRMVVTWKGYRFPVNEINPSSYGVNITAGIERQSYAILDPFWLDGATSGRFGATFSPTPNGDTISVECNPDRGSNRLQF